MIVPRYIRRAAVITMYGAYIVGAVMQWRIHEVGENRQAILAAFALAFAIGALLFATTHYMRWAGARDAALDEREIAARDAVYRIAYRVMAWASIGLAVWWYVRPLVSHPLTPDTNGHVVFWGYVLLLSTLPASLLAWKDRPLQP